MRLPMFLLALLAGLAGASPAARAAGPLPLKTGTYVLADTACENPPFAAMRFYDGRGLGGPHAADCRTRVLSRRGARYRVATTCRANGDGSPAVPATVHEILRIPSSRGLVAEPVGADVGTPLRYRRCGALEIR